MKRLDRPRRSSMAHSAEKASESSAIPSAARIFRVGVGLIVLALAVSALNNQSWAMSGVSLIWLSNGLLIGVLLCTPRRQWLAFFVLGYLIDLGVNICLGNPPAQSVYFGVCNMVEVILAAALMFPSVSSSLDLTEGRQLRSFFLYGVLLAPAIASLMATVFLRVFQGTPLSQSLRYWFAADVLGIATATPLYLSYHRGNKFSQRSKIETAGLFLALIIVTFAVFRLTNLPMLWLVLLFLLLLGLRLGFTGSAAGLLVVTFLGGYLTVEGYGPLHSAVRGSLPQRILVFQVFIILSMFALYLTEVAMAARRRTLSSLEASETRFRSLAEASRDVIMLIDLGGRQRYVSPAITELMGWKQEDMIGHEINQILHADDLASVENTMIALKMGSEPGPLAFRCLRSDGTDIWLEATVRMVPSVGSNEGENFVFVLRDVSDRKAAEERMQEAYETVERLAMVDGLTGVANRRQLDQTLSREWRNGRRNKTPLSLILLDVDHFKKYNDLYGHLAGDACLQKITREIQTVLRRPPDLLARYGGEEFLIILPETESAGAECMSERVRKVVENCDIAHAGSPHGVVTISLGCVTEIPTTDSNEENLQKAADAALYRAKTEGRNRIRVAGNGL